MEEFIINEKEAIILPKVFYIIGVITDLMTETI
jgi:hypothetical protein